MTLIDYLPQASELSAEELLAARNVAVDYLATVEPELDTRPGSVFDGFMLKPTVHLMAAINRAMDSFQRNTDVAAIAAGQVLDCDMAQRWLRVFGAKPADSAQQFGYVLMTFSSNAGVTIPGGTRFVFNSTDVFVPATGTITLLPYGTGVKNRLVRQAADRYVFPLQVSGYASSLVEAGTQAAYSGQLGSLISVTAQNDFVQGAVAVSIPQLARMAMETVHHSGFASRAGIVRHLKQSLGDVTGVVVSAPGDSDMLRSALTLSGLSGGSCVDVRVTSKYSSVISQPVYLPFISDQSGVSVDAFIGVFSPLHMPQRILSVTPRDSSDIQPVVEWFSRSADEVRAPMLSAAFSKLEELRVVVKMPRTSTGTALLDLGYDAVSTTSGAWFLVNYEAEPAVDAVDRLLEREGVVALDVLPKAPNPVIVDTLRFEYTADPGVILNAEQARGDLTAYLNGLFGSERISAEVMNDHVYAAGATAVLNVEFSGRVLLSVADYVAPASVALPETNYAQAKSGSIRVPVLNTSSLKAVGGLSYRDPALGTGSQTFGAVKPDSLRVLLTSDNPVYQHEA